MVKQSFAVLIFFRPQSTKQNLTQPRFLITPRIKAVKKAAIITFYNIGQIAEHTRSLNEPAFLHRRTLSKIRDLLCNARPNSVSAFTAIFIWAESFIKPTICITSKAVSNKIYKLFYHHLVALLLTCVILGICLSYFITIRAREFKLPVILLIKD